MKPRKPKAPRQWNSTIPQRTTRLAKGTKPLAKIGKGAKGRQQRFKKFLSSAAWKAQKQRVHERDGWRCTEIVDDGPLVGYPCKYRCLYTIDDGPLHADHVGGYGHQGLDKVPDEKIKTKCPHHHMARDGWKALRAMQVRRASQGER